MKKTLLFVAACSLIFGSAVAGEIETAHRYTAPLASVELTVAAVKGRADVSGQHMMAGSSAEVQELGGSMTLPAQVRERAEVQELGNGIAPMVRNSAEVQELGVSISGDARDKAEVQELGRVLSTKDRAEVQDLGGGQVHPMRSSAEVQDLGDKTVIKKDRAEVQELGRRIAPPSF
ncbi:MAG: hypothetical protein QTN59_15550 [Candidatus Electrothrix communis]|nr:MAG: hypothetical protein QTN59_15550 [Candidatus Electrothrix communis]